MLIETCFFSLPIGAALEDTPTMYSKVRVVKYWSKLPAFVVTATSVLFFFETAFNPELQRDHVSTQAIKHKPLFQVDEGAYHFLPYKASLFAVA